MLWQCGCIIVLASVNGDRKMCPATTATEENHCTQVQGSSVSLDGCEDIRCLASSCFWAVVKCRQFEENSEDAQNSSIYFGTSLFCKQPEINPHLTPIMTSLCKYQDAFCVLVSSE